MKKSSQLVLTKILIFLAIPLAGINFIDPATAKLTTSSAIKQIRRCTPTTCTPYRANYERAIANRIISRPSLVADENLAISLADRAISRGDRNEAARRLAQALVIISEKQGNAQALSVESALNADVKKKKGQTLRAFLPLFDRIFPTNRDPYR